MEPKEQDDAVARRREQNRLAQRRFRWKQSQLKAATRGQEKQQQQQQNKSTRAIRGQTETSQTHQARAVRPASRRSESFNLVTPSPSSDGTDPVLSLDPFHLPFGNDTSSNPSPRRPRTNSMSTIGTSSRTERAHSLATGMGGLLGDHGAVWDFTDLGAFSPPPLTSDTYPGDGLMTPSISLGGSVDEAPAPTAHSVLASSYQDLLDNPLLTPITASPSRSLGRGSSQQSASTLFDARTSSRTPDEPTQNQNSSQQPSPGSLARPQPSFSEQQQQQRRRQQQKQHQGPLDADNWLGPLHLAASKGHDRIVRMLLQHHQPVDEPDSDGQTALMHAVQGGFEDVVQSLLDAGAAVDSADKRGRTALHWAVLKRRKTLLQRLLENGNGNDGDGHRVMNVDVYDDEGQTPLHRAIDSGFEAGVEVLLEFGANLTCKTRVQKTGWRERGG